MADTYSEEFLDELIGSIDMEALVEELTGEEIDSTGKICCPFHEEDTGSFHVYEDGYKCFGACGSKKDGSGNAINFVKKIRGCSYVDAVEYLKGRSEVSFGERGGEGDLSGEDKEIKDEKVKPKEKVKAKGRKKKRKPAITEAVYLDILGNTSAKGDGYRGIGDKVLAKLGCLTEYSKGGAGEEVVARYYMYTEDQKLVAFKKRICDKEKLKAAGKKKDFRAIGRVRAENDLYGSYGHPNGGKVALIVGGEEDVHASMEMIVEEFNRRGWAVPVVLSPTVGEASCLGQIKHNYSYLDKFDEIIIALDNDEAGIKATEEIMKVLPKGKGSQVQWRHNDPNEYLLKGEGKEFREDFWRKKKDIPVGIVASTELRSAVIEELLKERVPLPPFMKLLEERCLGGFPKGVIINIGGVTGGGKTTIVNEMIYHWIFHSPYTIMPVSLELNKGQYAEVMYSRHLGSRLNKDQEGAVGVIADRSVELDHFDSKDNGEPRFYLIDDRDGTVEDVQHKIEECIKSLDIGVLILDPLNDFFDGLTIQDQTAWMRWEKKLVRSTDVIIVNICHFNKLGQRIKHDENGKMIMPEEADLDGSASIFKSGAINILTARDKNNEDPIIANTTYPIVTKGRGGIDTGPVSPWFYDGNTHTMYDKASFFKDKNTVQEVG